MMDKDQGSLPELPCYAGKCGTCQYYHIHPNCKVCGHKRKSPGNCQNCKSEVEDELYAGYCGICQEFHELPSCFHCQCLRYKPGQCKYCGAPGPDDKERLESTFAPCRRSDDEVDEARKISYSLLNNRLLSTLKKKTKTRNRINDIANYKGNTKYIAGQAR